MTVNGEIWRQLFLIVDNLRSYSDRHGGLTPDLTVSMSQIKVMGCIFQSPDGPVRVKDIAAKLNITPSGVSQIVDHLVNLGYVDRCIDPVDRRASCISLSAVGEKVRADLDAAFDQNFAGVTSGIPEDKLLICREVLSQILDTLLTKVKADLPK